MRAVPSGLLALQNADSRKPKQRFTFRDIRLRFASLGSVSSDPYSFNTDTPVHATKAFVPIDHYNNGSEIISAIGYNNTLYWRRVTTPGTLSNWNTWTQISGAVCKSGSRPSIFHNGNEKYVWTYDGAYIKCYITTDDTNWTVSGTFAFAPAGYDQIVGLASASLYDCFACAVDATGPVQKLSIWRISRYSGTITQWPNTIYSAAFSYSSATFFDAVQIDKDRFVVLYQETDSGLTMACLFSDGVWGAPAPVVPMDIVGTASFRVHGAMVIRGVIWVVGRMTRPGSVSGYDLSFDAIARSTDGINWTFDRNAYLTSSEIRGSLLLAADGYVYYPGLKNIWRAPSSYLIDSAGDPAAAKTVINEVEEGDLDIAAGDGIASQLQVSMSSSTSHGMFMSDGVVKGASLVFAELGYDASDKVKKTWPTTPSSAWQWNDGSYWPDPVSGETGLYQVIDVYDIDTIDGMDKNGQRSVVLTARGAVGKAMNMLTPQDYQYLSQVKWTDDFDAIDHIVRVSGAFSVASGELTAADTAFANVAWFTGPEGISSGLHGPVVQVQFKLVTSAAGKSAGIILSGKDSENYWYAKVDSAAIYLVERASGVETTVAQQTGLTFSADTWYWIKVTCRGGRFMVYTRANGSADWTLRLDYTHATANLPIFGRYEGYAGIRANMTANTVKFRNAFAWDDSVDRTTDSLIQSVATLAGVMSFRRDYAIAPNNPVSGWWSTSQHASLDLWFQIPGDVEAGLADNSWFIAFRSSTNVWATSNGYALRIRRDGSNQWIVTLIRRDGTAYDSATDDIERIILPNIRLGFGLLQARLLVTDKWITLYLNGYPVANFWNSAVSTAGYVGIHADVSPQSLQNLYMPELLEWRDNLILDMGSSYLSGMNTIVEGRFIQFFGEGLTLRYSKFSARDSLGSMTSGVQVSQANKDDTQRVSLVRVTGVEIVESLDSAIARDHGLVFTQVQNTAGNLASDLASDALIALRISKEDSEQIEVEGRPLMTAQNEDKVTIDYTAPDGTYSVNDNFVVDSLIYIFGPGELWMKFHGRKNYGG